MHSVTAVKNQSDTTPVSCTYISVPKPLHKDVKQYFEDLLNRGWIRKSRSLYCSPIVYVRKKDGSLCLYLDYRELNRKSIPDLHPIPRVQNVLNSLSGGVWFSALDQGKLYHQDFLEENCRSLTAFITPWGLFDNYMIIWVWIPEACPRLQQSSSTVWRSASWVKSFEDHLHMLSSTWTWSIKVGSLVSLCV